ncbi:hypothetical protein AX14_008643 [Amanita brunnescens Koide BX004]|nr:hypothetical protein AX14_008643 [Amanita brunnescens Koide BX004]
MKLKSDACRIELDMTLAKKGNGKLRSLTRDAIPSIDKRRPITPQSTSKVIPPGPSRNVAYGCALRNERSRYCSPLRYAVNVSTLPDAGAACNAPPEKQETLVPTLLLGCVMAPK